MRQIRTKLPQVAVLLPTTHKTCRELLRGILKFVHLHGPWAVHIIEGRAGEQKLLHLAAWGCTGIIGNLDERRYFRYISDKNIPAIVTNLDADLPLFRRSAERLNVILCDNPPIGRQAAEYFLERKFRHFAFAGEVNDASWSEARRIAFCERVAQSGFTCHVYPKLKGTARKDFSVEQAKLCQWLARLEKPVAILAANDVRGRQVLDSCLKAGIAVPQQCAVLGVDNDELFCETTIPQMSSIQMSTEQAGFEAARALDAMMRGERRGPVRQTSISYGFSHLVTRRSTETVLMNDLLAARALEFIRINAGVAVTVAAIARHLRVSRRLLETRFKRAMGRTVHAEVMRVRLERVQTLLLETAMTVEAIADCCGFTSASHLGSVFREHCGVPPSRFRKQAWNGKGMPGRELH